MQATEAEVKPKKLAGIPDRTLGHILEKSDGTCEWETVKGSSQTKTVLTVKGHRITAENNTLALISLIDLIPEKVDELKH
jgi:hypothetical protein